MIESEGGSAGGRRVRSATRCCSRPRPAAAGAACGWSSPRTSWPAPTRPAHGEAQAAFGDGRSSSSATCATPATSRSRCSGDGEGGAIHLGHRDCTLQRRYQKLVEEAPAYGLLAGARRADHRRRGAADRAPSTTPAPRPASSSSTPSRGSAGFLEINARLQVEHPVSEVVTGVDVVREMLRIAGGEGLSVSQDEVDDLRPRDRGADQRRVARARLRPDPRHADRLGAAARHRRARRHRLLPRLDGAALLRLAARQADRLRPRPRGGAGADPPGAAPTCGSRGSRRPPASRSTCSRTPTWSPARSTPSGSRRPSCPRWSARHDGRGGGGLMARIEIIDQTLRDGQQSYWGMRDAGRPAAAGGRRRSTRPATGSST